MIDWTRRSFIRGWRAPLVVALAMLAWSASANAGSTINNGSFGDVAIEGYDPVAYFTQSRAVKGSQEFAYEWLGATWYFASAEHRELFAAQPLQYAPQYGGHCALATAFGKSPPDLDPEAWSIVDGKLYLLYSKDGQQQWEQDQANMIATADQKWPELKAKLENDSGG
jgi:YHS domain-containing protein